jgi:hypothetical protein
VAFLDPRLDVGVVDDLNPTDGLAHMVSACHDTAGIQGLNRKRFRQFHE